MNSQRSENQELLASAPELFFANSLDLMVMVGADGYFKRVNAATENVLGYSEAELCAMPLSEFLHPEDIAKTKGGIELLSKGQNRIASINRYRCKNGNYKWFSWNTAPLGTIFYSIGRDITEQVHAEERIRQLNAELKQQNADLAQRVKERVEELQRSEAQVQQLQKMDAIGRLAGGIAHDFNNILGAITMFCDIISENTDKPDAVRERVQDLKSVSTRGSALTRQLLIFSRKQIAQVKTTNLNNLIEQLQKMLERLIGETITIATKFSPDLKSVSVDPSQIEQVILNLIVNAKDAMPSGGNITIETSNVYLDESFTSTHLSVERGHYVMVTVADEGMGMDAATVSKIFEPFFTTKPVGKGTGLGLSTTYGIIKQHKGTIWVYSEIGRGTVFKIYLPITDSALERIELAPTKRVETDGAHTILLVEDDEVLRVGFSHMLKKKGYQVLAAKGGLEAVELCKTYDSPIHLLLTDMVMPGLSGVEVARLATAMHSDLRVLFMSGYTSDVLENSGHQSSGQLNFIEKPFDTNALVTKIQEVLQL